MSDRRDESGRLVVGPEMQDDLRRRVRHWVAIGRTEHADDGDADAALSALFRIVPAPAPREGFATRAIEAVRRAPLPAGRRALVRPWARAGRIGIGLAAGATSAWLSARFLLPLAAGGFVTLIGLLVNACLWVILSLNAGLDVWAMLASAGRAIAVVVGTPQVSMALAVIGLVGAFALTALQRMLASEKESSRW